MSIVLVSITTAIVYIVVTVRHLFQVLSQHTRLDGTGKVCSLLALFGHGVVSWQALHGGEGLDLSLFKVAALFFLFINLAFLLSLFRRPLDNLLLALYPLSAVALLVAALSPPNPVALDLSPGIVSHISTSILAYAVLTLATLQAALVAAQDNRLKHKHTLGLIRFLPPLQLMETMLIELIWVGVVLLSLSIGTGFLFLDNMFEQQLVHKTVLSLLAWILYVVLLVGHYRLGWRSQTAVRYTLAGFGILALGYFGSKIVLELILGGT